MHHSTELKLDLPLFLCGPAMFGFVLVCVWFKFPCYEPVAVLKGQRSRNSNALAPDSQKTLQQGQITTENPVLPAQLPSSL